MICEEVTLLDTHDNQKIALWKVFNKQKDNQKHIFLTHGTFSNRKICLGISRYLAKDGFTCWIMEWRNHGHSQDCHKPFNFETVALYDIDAAFRYLFQTVKISEMDCITHSGGGISLTMFLLRNQKYISYLKSITMFSCQSFSACHTLTNRFRVWVGKKLSKLLGFTPGKRFRFGPHDEPYYTMKQWFDWNLNKNFIGKDGYDYKKYMEQITTPILSICAKGDVMISPVQACKEYLAEFNNDNNRLIICSKENGFETEYSHHSVMHSKTAAKEIWPTVLDWIQTH